MRNVGVAANSGGSASLEVQIVRCGCGDPDSHNGTRCQCDEGETCPYCARPCPNPRSKENLGTVGFVHPAKVVMFAHSLLQKSGYRYELWVSRGKGEVEAGSLLANAKPPAFQNWRIGLAYLIIRLAGYKCRLWVSERRDADAIRRGEDPDKATD